MNAVLQSVNEKSLHAGEGRIGQVVINALNSRLSEIATQDNSYPDFWDSMESAFEEPLRSEPAQVGGAELAECQQGEQVEIEEPELISVEERESARQLFGFQSVIDYGTSKPSKFIVDGLLVEGQPTMMCAPQKCLKTTLSIDLAISLASATPFMGRFEIPEQVRVCVMTGESGGTTVKETVERICREKGITLNCIQDWLYLTDSLPMLYQPDSMNKLRECIQKLKPRVLILDPAYKMMKGDQGGNLFVMGGQLNELSDLGCTPIVNHHVNKEARSSYKPLGLEAPSFTGFAEYFRQWILINRREAYRTGSGNHKIWFTYGGSAGQSGNLKVDLDEGPNSALEGRDYRLSVEPCNGGATSDELKQSKQMARSERDYERLKNVLKEYPSGLSQTRISSALGMSPQAGKKLLENALCDGVVDKSEGKSGKQNCVMFFLVQKPLELADKVSTTSRA